MFKRAFFYIVPLGLIPLGRRVDAGMAFLDDKCPGWRSRVAVDDISIFSPFMCIIGQLHGDFNAGRAKLGLSAYASARLGFYSPKNDEMGPLGALWRRRLSQAQG